MATCWRRAASMAEKPIEATALCARGRAHRASTHHQYSSKHAIEAGQQAGHGSGESE